MKNIQIYNTLKRKKELFVPIRSGEIRMYVCGMTVYDYCHVGHARVMVVFDMVQRWLKTLGYRVTYVRNITDIDDKIIQRAAENQESMSALTQRFIDAMHEDSERLGIQPPDHEPKATEYVPQMQGIISRLLENKLAYVVPDGDVNFSVRRFQPYGKLSGKTLDDLRAGERVSVDQEKQDPLDFVLWKKAKQGEPAWNSPWGEGRPGWHIECSAMSCTLLGEEFDIHGGGADLQFPHHENEIAQSEGATGKNFVNYWMHNGFVRVDNEKMSKSLGNFFTIRDVLSNYDPEVVRFFILRAHYRSPLNYSNDHLDDAKQALTRLYTALNQFDSPISANADAIDWENPFAKRFETALCDDFNTPEAFAVLFELVQEVNKNQRQQDARLLLSLAACVGLLTQEPAKFLRQGVDIDEGWIQTQIQLRQQAKVNKQYAQADQIRQMLLEKGIVLEDSPNGQTAWRSRVS
jgi:cysteinyl-tRNA synthetase